MCQSKCEKQRQCLRTQNILSVTSEVLRRGTPQPIEHDHLVLVTDSLTRRDYDESNDTMPCDNVSVDKTAIIERIARISDSTLSAGSLAGRDCVLLLGEREEGGGDVSDTCSKGGGEAIWPDRNVLSVDNPPISNEIPGRDDVTYSGNTRDVFVLPTDIVDVNVYKQSFSFSFLHWNVNGLLNKLQDTDFVSFLCTYDFICIVETFLDTLDSAVFSTHKCFCRPAVRFPGRGRPSGGICVLIRNEYAHFFRQIEYKGVGNFIVFILDKKLFDLEKDILIVCVYVPPEGSPYYVHFDVENGISLLEDCLMDCLVSNTDFHVLLCGDLNSRTSNVFQPLLSKANETFFVSLHKSQSVHFGRKSQDTNLNGYGKMLINLCTVFNLCILNGVCLGDLQGCCTYISDTGSSVNDYFILSAELFSLFYDSCQLSVLERIESDHLPLSLVLNCSRNKSMIAQSKRDNSYIEKFVWNAEKKNEFINDMNSDTVQRKLQAATVMIDVDVNASLDMFNDCIKQVAGSMKKKVFVNSVNKKKDWYDAECCTFRKCVRQKLNKFRLTLNARDRDIFCVTRREYKNLLRRKKKTYNDALLNNLVRSVNDQYTFWESVHKIPFKKGSVRNNVSIESWFEYFKNLLEKVDVDDDDVFTDDTTNDEEDEENDVLNAVITKEEILLALRKLKCKKAAGPDGIIGELLKNSGVIIVDYFVVFFNALFDRGLFPDSWTESVILPLYKKGDVNNPENYRGISLCNISSKVYSSVINNRLQRWVNIHDTTGEWQAGFKKDHSTIDHMFTLLACVQKQFSLNRKLYVAFIDFEKAFDSINRNLLWPILLKSRIKGKCLRCIRSMYESVRAKVRCGSKLTDVIHCSYGVKQGDVCSPILFSLFINELAVQVIRNGRHGVTLPLDSFELFILLLADDVALLSETVVGLQRQLDNLQNAASALELKVNMKKSNIVVFRKGGYLAAREHWYFEGVIMPVVNVYKYLGILFSTKLSFSASCQDLASKGKNALVCIMQKLYILNNNSLDVFLKLFDACIQPIVNYGAELWALDDAAKHCEKTHLFALKRFLGVDRRTPNDLVYGELNRFPLTINAVIKCIRYWLKLNSMLDSRLPRKAYLMLYKLDERGKQNWVSKVRIFLFKYGFGFVWMNENVGDVKGFLSVLKQRMIDCRWQTWESHMNDSERFCMYRGYSDLSHTRQQYLLLNLDRHIKNCVVKFKFGISNIRVHYYRYRAHRALDLMCPLCEEAVEDEIHFVLVCPALSNLRNIFIPAKYYLKPNLFRFNLLMASVNEIVVKNLCLYLYKAFQLRDALIT